MGNSVWIIYFICDLFHTAHIVPLFKNCEDCNDLRKSSEFDCAWCDSVHRCSDGADRLREHWEAEGCAAKNVSGDGQGWRKK